MVPVRRTPRQELVLHRLHVFRADGEPRSTESAHLRSSLRGGGFRDDPVGGRQRMGRGTSKRPTGSPCGRPSSWPAWKRVGGGLGEPQAAHVRGKTGVGAGPYIIGGADVRRFWRVTTTMTTTASTSAIAATPTAKRIRKKPALAMGVDTVCGGGARVISNESTIALKDSFQRTYSEGLVVKRRIQYRPWSSLTTIAIFWITGWLAYWMAKTTPAWPAMLRYVGTSITCAPGSLLRMSFTV